MMRSRQFDLVILDHHMPGMTGLQLLEQLRVDGVGSYPTSIVFFSADACARDNALALGAAEFALKAGDDSRILGVMTTYAGGHQF